MTQRPDPERPPRRDPARPGPGSRRRRGRRLWRAQAPQPGYGSEPWSGSASLESPDPAPWSGAAYEPPRRPAAGRGMEDRHRGAGHNWRGRGRRHRRATPSESFRLTAGRGVGIGVGGYAPVRQGCPADRQRDQHAGHRGAAQRVQVDLLAGLGQRVRPASAWPRRPTGPSRPAATRPTWRIPAEPNTNILVDLAPHTYPNDMLREARFDPGAVDTRIPRLPPARPGGDQHPRHIGLLWKFTWAKAGVQQEALDLLFVLHTSAGPRVATRST